MTTHSHMSVLRLMGNMEAAARDAAVSDGEKVSVTKDGTIREHAISVTYTFSRRKDGASLERWTWRLDGKRMNSDALCTLLESLPVAVATGAAVPRCIVATTDRHEGQLDGHLYAYVPFRFNPKTMSVESCASRMMRIEYDDIDRDGIAHVVIGLIGSALRMNGQLPDGVTIQD